jgi:hypothetical protein
MDQQTFDKLRIELLSACNTTTKEKGPAYTGEDKDVLSNFKQMAKRFGVSPLVVWGIYMNKHVDAINSFIKNPKIHLGSEPPESRIVDIINYAVLGQALLKEQEDGSIQTR